MSDKCNCYRFSPRDSLSGAVAQIADYLSKHPGWNETELRAFVDGLISATGVESFNGRTGTVILDKNDVNNLKIASAYFAEGGESIDSLDLVSLYNQGVRFVFTDFNSVTSKYNLAFALEYFSGSGDVVYYPMSTATSGGNIVSVNGKTGEVHLKVVDVSNGNSPDENAYIFIDESDDYPDVISPDSSKLGGQLPSYYASAEEVSTLKDDLSSVEKNIKYAYLENVAVNGNFDNTSGYIYDYCTASADNNVLTVSGDGNASYIGANMYKPISLDGYKYFAGAWVRVLNENCQKIMLLIANDMRSAPIVKPIKDKWYYIATRLEESNLTGNCNAPVRFKAYWEDSSGQAEGKLEIKQVSMIALTEDFGLGEAPALYQMMDIIKYNDWWSGKKDVIIWKKTQTGTTRTNHSYAGKRRPVVTFINDDGYQADYDKLVYYSEVFQVPFCTAMIAPIVGNSSTINTWCALYLQNELGWEFTAHPSCGAGGLATLETEDEIDMYLRETKNYVRSLGLDCENVVYDSGEPDERVRRLARKYYKCGAVGSHPMINTSVIGNYEIQRVPIGYGQSDNTLTNLKRYVDLTIEKNGWCVFMLHPNMPTHTDEVNQTIGELIEYIKSQNVDILTLRDGFEIFGNAFESGDYTGRADYAPFNLDSTRGIAISKDGEVANLLNYQSTVNLVNAIGSAIGKTITVSYDEETRAYKFIVSG